jgi:hypothetical protein
MYNPHLWEWFLDRVGGEVAPLTNLHRVRGLHVDELEVLFKLPGLLVYGFT